MLDDVVERARSMIGSPFRVHGRNHEHGLDCVGLVLVAHQLPEGFARSNYRLRGDHLSEIDRSAAPTFRRVGLAEARPGDVIVMEIESGRFHLVIWCGASFVHADAAIGRVVESPDRNWPVRRVFRRRQRQRN